MFQDMPVDKVYTLASFSQHYGELEKESSGAFGNVFKVSVCSVIAVGLLINMLQDYQTNMAIKIIKSQSLAGGQVTEHTYKSVRKEIDKLLYFEVHPHIVNILGVFLKPYGIMLELAPMGDLQSIINKYKYRDNLMCSTAILLTIQQVGLLFVCVM